MTSHKDAIRVAAVMDEIERDVRNKVRARLVERGVTEYEDTEIFERVRAVLQHAADRSAALRGPIPGGSLDGLLLPELLADDAEWTLEPDLRLSSHRPLFGQAILFAKQRLLLPLTRWLFEYSQSNFRRQQQINRLLFACIEELAIESARLRRDLDALSKK